MPLERARYDVNGQTLIVIGLPDRRVRGGAEILWCMQKSFELILFGSNSSAIHRLYERCALQQVQGGGSLSHKDTRPLLMKTA